MTIADYLIKQVNIGNLRMDKPSKVQGMGETWDFIPNRKYGPGHLVNTFTGSILSVADISLREIDGGEWRIV